MGIQYARPIEDIAVGNWTTSSGTAYYALVDEATPNDSGYLICSEDLGAENELLELKLSSIAQPVRPDGLILWVRAYSASGDQMDLTVSLKQGGTTLTSQNFRDNSPDREIIFQPNWDSGFANLGFFIPPSAVASITAWDDLRVGLVGSSMIGGDVIHVSQVYLEAPPSIHTNQVFVPDAILVSGGWSGAVSVVETFDGNYLTGDRNSTTVELGLPSITDPSTSTGHVITTVYGGDSSNESTDTLTGYLYQGATLIATLFSGVWSNENPTTIQLAVNYELTASEADSITDYTDLELHFDNTTDASSEDYNLNSVYLTIPASFFKVFPGLVSFTQTLYSATASFPAGTTVNAGLVSFTQTLYSATAVAPVQVSPGLISFTQTLYSATARQRIDAGLISFTQTLYFPTAVASVQVSPGLISFTQTLYAATGTNPISAEAGLISFTQTLNTASVFTAIRVNPELLSFSQTLYSATGSFPIDVSVGLISFSQTLYSASGTFPVEVSAGLISCTNTQYSPEVSLVVNANLISHSMTLFTPIPGVPIEVVADIIQYTFSIYKFTVFITQTSFEEPDPDNYEPTMNARTTRLEAINTMLSCIGEAPINSLVDVTSTDALLAINVLNEISKEVQSVGWAYNTDYDFPLVPNENGQIVLSNDIVRVDLNERDYPHMNIQIRGNRLYERNEQTYQFEDTINATIVRLFKFVDLPEVVSRYITIRAARTFANRFLGAQEINVYTQEEEFKARAVLMDAEAVDDDINILSSSPYTLLNTYRPSDTIMRRW